MDGILDWESFETESENLGLHFSPAYASGNVHHVKLSLALVSANQDQDMSVHKLLYAIDRRGNYDLHRPIVSIYAEFQRTNSRAPI